MQPFFLFKFERDEYEREQSARPVLAFSVADLEALSRVWEPARFLSQDHEGAAFALPSGQVFKVSAEAVSAPAALDHQWFRAAMLHIETQWQGRATIPASQELDAEARLMARAYAEVYGVELDDANELCGRPLSRSMLDRLPELRREIRVAHPDAPAQRPDEAQQLAAMYARRYPFRVAVAA